MPRKTGRIVSTSSACGATVISPTTRSAGSRAAANRAQLLAAGLRPEHVELSEHCTSCRVDRFFSHRAERGQAGRQAAIVGQL